MSAGPIFAQPVAVSRLDDCDFYHVMDLPGHGMTGGLCDLRDGVDEYLGHFVFAGKRVLEIGPASGFLTFEMEKRGARVVAVEVSDEHLWDYVPFPDPVMKPIHETRRRGISRLKMSFWLAHAAYQSRSQVYYGDLYRLPQDLGNFDVAVLAAVLLHTQSPLQIIDQCAMRSRALIITDVFHPELEGQAICRLHPTAENAAWDTWWHFSTDFFLQYLSVLGFAALTMYRHVHFITCDVTKPLRPVTFFTIVASKGA